MILAGAPVMRDMRLNHDVQCSPVYCQDWLCLLLRLYLSTRERPGRWQELSEHIDP